MDNYTEAESEICRNHYIRNEFEFPCPHEGCDGKATASTNGEGSVNFSCEKCHRTASSFDDSFAKVVLPESERDGAENSLGGY